VLPSLQEQILSDLAELRQTDQYRDSSTLAGPDRTIVHRGDQPLISFCSNDYLGLATSPALRDAAIRSLHETGVGSAASRLVTGTHPEHEHLEHALATHSALPSALLFPSGYQANVGVITALLGPEDLVLADRAVHASILDGCRLSRAKLAVFPPLDILAADRMLRTHGPGKRRRLLVTESLFSMDGDVAPLRELSAIAKDNDTAFMVDEAHALGALGPSGRGLCASLGLQPDILVGTLGKAFGTAGAFVACSQDLRSYLINRARSYIFTTASPPSLSAASLAALHIIASPQGDLLRTRLAANVAQLRHALSLPTDPYHSPIIPILLGTNRRALDASAFLAANGYFVQAIRPPTVRPGHSRLRVTLSSQHSPAEIEGLARALTTFLNSSSDPNPSATLSPPQSSQPTLHKQPPDSSTIVHRRPRLRGLLIAGTDTNVGKTTLACALLRLLSRDGHNPVPFKPAQTGTPSPEDDASLLQAAAGRPDLPLDLICPYSFSTPIAPSAAARLAGTSVTLDALTTAALSASERGGPLVVEAAGGLLSPYAPGLTSADLALALDIPILLVARNALGTVNHTTLAINEIRRRHLRLLGTILVSLSSEATPDQPTNLQQIEENTGVAPLGVFPYCPNPQASNLAAVLESAVDLRPVLRELLPGL
jgi:8-amino-7-oxononanoate synthase